MDPGKDLLLLTTALSWYLGIVMFDSDYAFTVTNVITHGIPYLILVQWYRLQTAQHDPVAARPHWVKYVAIVWILAYAEEFVWDVGVWHERGWLFGTPQDWSAMHAWLVPLLAVPQITHYVLDGFIWRRKQVPAWNRVPACDEQGTHSPAR